MKAEMLEIDDAFAAPPLVMVVDDEVLIRIMASDMLRDAGFEVVEACSADEAISLLAAGMRCSLVFSDVNMPGSTDGIGLAAYVREHYPIIPVVLTSGRLLPHEMTEAGAAAVLLKPYTEASLTSTIGQLLGQADD